MSTPKYNPYSAELFRDYFNNFLTVEKFAEYIGKDLEYTKQLINEGRIAHEMQAQEYKDKVKS